MRKKYNSNENDKKVKMDIKIVRNGHEKFK